VAEHPPLPYEHPITEDVYAQLFKDVGTDESIAQGFFARRIAREGDIGILCAYDSTTIDAETRDPEARDGMSKSHTGNRSIKVLVLYSMRTRRPLAYAKQPGNVPDVLSIENTVAMLKALGAKRVTIVTDVGFASELNLGTLLHSGDHVLTKVKTNWKWVREQIEAHWDELQRLTNITKCDAMVKGITVDVTREFPFKRLRGSKKKGLKAGDTDRVTRRVHLHVYYDTERKCAQDREFIEDLWEVQSLVEEGLPLSKRQEDMRDKYLDVKKRGKKVTTAIREDEVNEACKYHGVFALVSDNIKDASEALETYREREWVEDYFERMKNDAGDHTARTGNPENLNGRLFAQFVAMCYLEELHERIRKMKDTLGKPNGDPVHDTKGNLDKERKLKAWLKKRSMYRTLLWFDAHETIKVSTDVAKRRWNTETVARDRLFLERLGVTKASA
jgi:transposase